MTIGEVQNVERPVNWERRLAAQLFLHQDGPVQLLHNQTTAASPCYSWTTPLALPPTYPERALQRFLAENHGLRFWGAGLRPSCFTLSCKPFQSTLKVSDQGGQQNYIICEKQRCTSEAPKLDTLSALAASPDPVRENQKQDQRQNSLGGVQHPHRNRLSQ